MTLRCANVIDLKYPEMLKPYCVKFLHVQAHGVNKKSLVIH